MRDRIGNFRILAQTLTNIEFLKPILLVLFLFPFQVLPKNINRINVIKKLFQEGKNKNAYEK